MTDPQLLAAYATRNDQAAFAELVRRHVDWVYSTARRLVRDAQSAEDVTQAVFILVAQKAPLLAAHRQLNGWLFRATRYCAANALKQQSARRRHEQEAAAMRPQPSLANPTDPLWLDIAPRLDAALARLSGPDRETLLLKFYQNKTAAEVAATLGVSEVAARKRLQRALDRLRTTLAGAATSSSALGATLAIHVTQPAPATIAHAIAAAKTTAAAPLAKAAANAMWRAQAKIAAAILLTAAIAGTIAYEALIHGLATKATPAAIAAPSTLTPHPVASAARLPPATGAVGGAASHAATSARAPSPLDPVMAMADPSSSTDITRFDQIFTATTPVETQVLDHIRALIRATENFANACKTIDPAGSIPSPKLFAINGIQKGASLQDSIITQLDADNADIALPLDGGGPIRAIRTPSGWRIPLSWVLDQSPLLRRHPQLMFDYVQSCTDLLIALTDEIKSKKLNTPDAVKSELDTRSKVIQARLNDAAASARKSDRQRKPRNAPADTMP